MLVEFGGVEAARRLLWKREPSEGFTTLWELKRLDLPVEAYILRPEYAPLFTEEERGIARAWLKQYGYPVPQLSRRKNNSTVDKPPQHV